MQEIELLLEGENKEDLYKSIKLYQYLKGDLEILSFLESQMKRHLNDEQISDLDCDLESIFNKLHFNFKDQAEEPRIKGERNYEFDIVEIKNILKDGIKNKNDVEIEYFNASGGNFRKFKVRPDQISGNMLESFDYKKGEERYFKLNRIKNVRKI